MIIIKNKSLIIKILISIISIVLTVIVTLSIFKLNIIPNKYIIYFIISEVILNLIIILLILSKKKILFIIGLLLMVLIGIINIVINNYVNTTNDFIDKGFTEYVDVFTDYIILTSISNPNESIDNSTIYYHKYSRSIDLALKELNKINSNYIETDSINSVLDTMKNENVFLLISKGNYDYLMESTILYKSEDYKIVKEFTVSYKEEKNDTVKDSYTIYLNGVDFTGIMRDFNMLITVNTKTKKILTTPILRGYYIDVPAYNIKDTLMCLGSLDSNVSKEALEKLFNIKIDYTVNVNTNSLVNVVDTLGGLEFCSDYEFVTTHVVTDNTYNDKYGTKLRVIKGCREYNGKEILTIARERLNLKNNERGRIENCRKILISIGKKTLSTTSLLKFDEVLNSFSSLYTTDMNKKVITNLFKSVLENYNDYEITSQTVDGTDGKAIGHLGTQEVGVTFPDLNQVNEASKRINEIIK